MLSLVLALALGGCSGSQVIDLYAADYRETAASAADAQLLLNILRAKDDLPIHFSDLAIIHGVIQGTAGVTAGIPIAQNGAMTATTIMPNLTVTNMPTFDVGTLDTDAFTKGMLTQADPKIIQQLFDQGVDPRLLALLFISEYRDHRGKVFQNNMSCDPAILLRTGECRNRVNDLLDKIDDIFSKNGLTPAQARVNSYVKLRPVGGPLSGPWTLDNLDQLRQLDPAKQKLIDKRLYSISEPRLMICYEKGGHLRALFPSPVRDMECNYSEVKGSDSPREAGTFSLRSPYQIIQFLGQVLRFQEETGRCLLLGKEPEDGRCDTGEVLFQVNAPFGTPVVGTRYRDGWYALYDRHCNKEQYQPCDYSLQVLAILELLLNENKSAKDIIAIPRVQVVQ
jgi:hypothetical protein